MAMVANGPEVRHPKISTTPDDSFERDCMAGGFNIVAGVDEAGRGPLAGPVVAAAVILKHPCNIVGVNDSKKLSPEKRAQLIDIIKENCVSWGVGIIEPDEIDRVNILQASLLAMKVAIFAMTHRPEIVLVDGNQRIPMEIRQKTIIKGDSKSISIAAASIIAKVTRDEIMSEIHKLYPQYGFEKHKGYPTLEHKELIAKYGPCSAHRKSFSGVKEYIGSCPT